MKQIMPTDDDVDDITMVKDPTNTLVLTDAAVANV